MRRESPARFGPIRSSLQTKVTLGIVAPLLLILGAITAVQLTRHRQIVLESVSLMSANGGKAIEASLRREILNSHFEATQPLLDTIDETGEFRVIYLLDPAGKVLISPQGADVGLELSNDQPDCQPCHRLPENERPASVVIENGSGERFFRSMVPMENTPDCAECHLEEGTLALLLTDTPMMELEASFAADLWENLLWLGSVVLVTVIVVNLALNQLVIKRVQSLTKTIIGFSRGRHDLRFPSGDPDEVGQLAETFNELGQRVQAEEAANRALSDDLRQQNALRGELLKRLITAQEDERQRLSHEIHDELGQALSGLALQTEVMQRFLPPGADRARTQVSEIQSLIASTTDSMYDLILALRPSALDDLGLAAALRTHAERTLANTGTHFEMDASEFAGRLPSEMEIAIYRMFQEALSNVVRHASAKHVRFTLARRAGAFEGQIEDDGRGFNPEETHFYGDQPRGLGLVGMRERVTQFGGKLGISSQYGNGTHVRIHIPLEADSHE